MKKIHSMTRITTWMAAVVAVATAVILPAGFFAVSHQYLAGSLETEAEFTAAIIARTMQISPQMGGREKFLLEEILASREPSGHNDSCRIYALDGTLLAEHALPQPHPYLKRSKGLNVDGVTVATLEVSRSLQPTLIGTLLAFLFGLTLGALLFTILRILPLKAIVRAEQEIERLAYYDSLTTLPNRALLKDRLRQSIAKTARDQKRAAVLFLDLDRFKGVNDTLGHIMGDRLLQEVARRLSSCLRETDTVARIGGDEFVVLLTGLSKGQEEYISIIARKILDQLSTPVILDDKEIFTSCSIGIAVCPGDGEEVDTLLKHADLAMYQAKEQGRNNFQFFSRQMNDKVLERLMLENNLRRALERDELFLVYQPKMDLEHGALSGMEALLRWNHPELGLIMPGRFMPLAEETGLIRPIGEWVLRTACTQNKAWQDAGQAVLPISVNLSGKQMLQQDLAEKVASALAESGLAPHYLELELTESTVMSSAEETIIILQKLKQMGVSLAVDDFGTGYSSLSYLKHFPIDRLKIDRTFVRDITSNPDDAAIAEAIIAMAESLKLRVTAEGVELKEQLDFLLTRGCDEMQGFYFSHPIPADKMVTFFKDQGVCHTSAV